MIAAAVVPARAEALSDTMRSIRHYRIPEIMLEHGHVDEAIAWVESKDDPARQLPSVMFRIFHHVPPGDRKVALMRRAAAIWRETHDPHFLRLLVWHYDALPLEEARLLAGELVYDIVEHGRIDIQSPLPVADGCSFTSSTEYWLFQILHVLQRLDPSLAESLIARFPELAASARRFPFGMESVREEARKKAKPGKRCGYVMSGTCQADFDYQGALIDAQDDKNFDPAITVALGFYAEDTAPGNLNQAPREFWPSVQLSAASYTSPAERSGLTLRNTWTAFRSAMRGCSAKSSSPQRSPACPPGTASAWVTVLEAQ